MTHCISCGAETDRTYAMYECHIGDIEKVETRTEYIPTNFKPQKRIHYKIVTSFDETKEHQFGYCNSCLYTSRKTGLKLMLLAFPLLALPGAALLFPAGGLASGTGSTLFWSGLFLGFAAAITFFTSLHLVFASNKKSPYYAKKAELNDAYMEANNCKVLMPKEYEYLKKNEFRETKTTFSDVVS